MLEYQFLDSLKGRSPRGPALGFFAEAPHKMGSSVAVGMRGETASGSGRVPASRAA